MSLHNNGIVRISSDDTDVPLRILGTRRRCPQRLIVVEWVLLALGGPHPPPATGTETDAVRARAGPAYLDKMQISFSVSPFAPLAGPLSLSKILGKIRGRPLDSARAASLDFLLDSGSHCMPSVPAKHISSLSSPFWDYISSIWTKFRRWRVCRWLRHGEARCCSCAQMQLQQ